MKDYNPVTDQEREQIVSLLNEGKGYEEVAKITGRKFGTVCSVWYRHKREQADQRFFNVDRYAQKVVTI